MHRNQVEGLAQQYQRSGAIHKCSALSIAHQHLYDDAKITLDQLRTTDSIKDIRDLMVLGVHGYCCYSESRYPKSYRSRRVPGFVRHPLQHWNIFYRNFPITCLSATFSYPPGTIVSLCMGTS